MSYFIKDFLQIKEIAKSADKVLLSFNIEEYEKEITYWSKQYPMQLQVWEDDGGFIINERFLYE